MYIGRFAPSPTGPLHFGSLVAAVASFLEAKSNKGKWLVRMEDLDKPREVAGAANDILKTLDNYGFEWDEVVMYQSQRSAAYAQALDELQKRHLVYPCTCSRKEIADSALQTGIEGAIYPKTCFLKPKALSGALAAYRVITKNELIQFDDAIQDKICQNLAADIGDFVLKRADGQFAYQLAAVVDDMELEVTHIVRGADLLNSTPRQIYLQQLLGFATPSYAHLPVAVNQAGEKLSKQTLAEPIARHLPSQQLYQALCFLGQNPPSEMQNATLIEVWRWAKAHWSLNNIPHQRSMTYL